MSLFSFLHGSDPEAKARQAEADRRQADILHSLVTNDVPASTRRRLEGARTGTLPWIATLTPAELRIVRTHGLRPIASVSATCWLHYGWSWTEGHAEGWGAALQRLRAEAKVAGANAVIDVKMRTVPLQVEHSMDFTLVGTAVHMDGLPPSSDPIVATVPALEFVKLLEADVVPTGLAVGAKYHWMTDWRGNATAAGWGNTEAQQLSQFWESIRKDAHAELRRNAVSQGNGVLAHVNFSQMFEFEGDKDKPRRFLGRHIVVATTVEARRGNPIPHELRFVVDVHDGGTPLTGTTQHHQSYASNDKEGAI